MTNYNLPVLTFMVINAKRLESGLTAQYTVNKEGASIGSSPLVNWRLTDTHGAVSPKHCQVEVLDGAYCLKDISGQTYVNGAQLPIGAGNLARLQHEDELAIGPYRLRVLIASCSEDLNHYGRLETLIAIHGEDLLHAMDIDQEDEEEEKQTDPDPLHALDELIEIQQVNFDLLSESESVESEKRQSLVSINQAKHRHVELTPQADSEYEMTSSIRLKEVLGFGKANQVEEHGDSFPYQEQLAPLSCDVSALRGNIMDEREFDLELDRLEEEVAKSFKPEEAQANQPSNRANHLITGPVLDGLGVDISDEDDMERMHLLSQEMGESLQACVRGLLELHQQVTNGRFGTLNRNLQPIEDNPLRLGMSYEETIRTLYDTDKSIVHLSAPAAIAESLKTVRDHNEAMQFATSDALSQILNAFAPEVMLRRFQYYKRNHIKAHVSQDEWAWNMYCNYYQELTSNRQHGFEKLFWEIFEQSYDRKLREKQREF